MYFNNYIQMLLYVPQVLVLLALVFFMPKTKYYKSVKIGFVLLVLLSLFGISMGYYLGFSLGKSCHHMKEDITKLITFVFFIGLPFFISGISEEKRQFTCKAFNVFAVTYTLLVLPNIFFAPGEGSIYPGNLFRASTVNLVIISSWCFYTLAFYYTTKQRRYLYWSLICYLCVVASLAKWNAIAILAYPVMLYVVGIKYNVFFSTKTKLRLRICTIIFSTLIVVNFSSILNPFAHNFGYDSFDEYLNSRVFGDPQNKANLSVTAFDLSEDKGIRDGARLIMWSDMINRTMSSPWVGVGIGSRALEELNLNMEDHNIFVTHISRYGIPLFLLWLILVYRLFRFQYLILPKSKSVKPIRHIYIAILMSFFFQASVGNIWGQLLVALFIGSGIGFLITESSKYEAKYK